MATDSQMMSTGYKQGDLKKLLERTYAYSGEIDAKIGCSPEWKLACTEKIDIDRTKTFTIKFTMNGIQYEFIDGYLCNACGSETCNLPAEFLMFEMYNVAGVSKRHICILTIMP